MSFRVLVLRLSLSFCSFGMHLEFWDFSQNKVFNDFEYEPI